MIFSYIKGAKIRYNGLNASFWLNICMLQICRELHISDGIVNRMIYCELRNSGLFSNAIMLMEIGFKLLLRDDNSTKLLIDTVKNFFITPDHKLQPDLFISINSEFYIMHVLPDLFLDFLRFE